MNQTTKNIIYVLVGLIIVVLIISLIYKGMNGTSYMPAATTTTADYNGAGGTQSNGTGGTTGTTGTKGTTATTPAAPSLENLAVLNTVIGNSLVRVPQTGTDVALTAGGADYTDTNGTAQGHIQAGPILGWVKTDTGYDVFTDMTVTKKAQVPVLHYVALFHVISATNVKYTSSVLVGDRLVITGIKASPDKSTQVAGQPAPTVMSSNIRYVVTISYLDRKNGEPLTATPTLAKTMDVGVKNHVISK